MDLKKIDWDRIKEKKRNDFLLRKIKNTLLFAKKNVPFYQKHLDKFSEKNIYDISSIEDFAFTIPETTREHLTNNKHTSFLSKKEPFIYFDKGTGGTTKRPIPICYTKSEWKFMAQTKARSVLFDFGNKKNKLEDLKIMGLYHGDHITNHIYRAMFELLNIEFFDRITTKNEIEPNYSFFIQSESNAILGPPSLSSLKGLSLPSFFKYDSTYINHYGNDFTFPFVPIEKINIKAVFWSSSFLDKEFYSYLKDYLKIPYIKGHYGSTEVLPIGSTCSEHPHDFHIDFMPNLALVKTSKGLAKNNERGYITVSKIDNPASVGTMLINYKNGDAATYINEKCKCQRNTPILINLSRIEDKEAKAVFGCEVS